MAGCVDIQTIYVVRHAERLDSVDEQWKFRNADRDYDTPITEEGERLAKELGKAIKSKQPVSCLRIRTLPRTQTSIVRVRTRVCRETYTLLKYITYP